MNACEKTCVYVWRGNRNLQKVQPSAGFGFSSWLKATPVSASHADRLATVSGRARHGPLAQTRTLSQVSIFVACAAFWQGRAHISCTCMTFARSSADFVTGAAFSYFWHGRIANPIGTDAQGGARRFRGRPSIFARSGTDFVAGASLSQGQVPISWQVQHFRKVSSYFVAGAALSQGHVHISWQVQHFRKVKCRIRGRRSTFARSTFAAGARKTQLLSAKVVSEVNFRSWRLKIVTFKCESSARSPLSQPGLKIATA